MINNLFSVFDPASSIFLTSNWVRRLLFVILIIPTYWLCPNPVIILISNIKETLHIEIKTLLGSSSFKGRTILLITSFFIIIFNNFIGLFPYIFTSTSHIATTLTLALPLWLSFIIFGWFNYTKYMLAHLVPQGTPSALISFMVLIETVRNLIRPGTLAIRLSANIIAGHLLLTLLGNQTAQSSPTIISLILFIQILLLVLECAVSIIQSYVFIVLSTLYSRESTSH